jgi:signal peptidase II
LAKGNYNDDMKRPMILAAALILLDQFTKHFAATYLTETYSENVGVAFGIPIPYVLLIVINIALLGVILAWAHKDLNIKNPIEQSAIALVIAGGVGNLIDRITQGFVVDFISIWIWPTFNFADIYIVVGILLLIIFYAKIRRS